MVINLVYFSDRYGKCATNKMKIQQLPYPIKVVNRIVGYSDAPLYFYLSPLYVVQDPSFNAEHQNYGDIILINIAYLYYI